MTKAKTKKPARARKPKFVPVSDWGKDHWSLVAYVEIRCVDNGGVLDHDRMRTNQERHPGLAGPASAGLSEGRNWRPEWGTRLSGYFLEDGETDLTRQMFNHDDWDVLDDIEAAGYVKIGGAGINPVIFMTRVGAAIAALLRVHKAAGKHFASFDPSRIAIA